MNFTITIGQTYLEQGFFYVPVAYTDNFAEHGAGIEIWINGAVNPMQGTINRTANPTNAPRIRAGTELRDWMQANFNLNDLMQIEVLAPNSIRLSHV
jgi:hypothetical protein